MSGSTEGIKQLLKAEKQAADVVKAARNRRTMRMKQAKVEADEEIKVFRAQLEKEVSDMASATSSAGSSEVAAIQEDADKQIADINVSVTKNTDDVIKTLLGLVMEVTPVVHRNYTQK
eukprot:gene1358-21700_t